MKCLTVGLLMTLAACSSRPGPQVLQPLAIETPANATTVKVYAVTNRAPLDGHPYAFGADRMPAAQFLSYEVSIPPNHTAGHIEWPVRQPNPATDFITTSHHILNSAALTHDIANSEAVGLYVHGYNTSFQEAVYRMAQMRADVHMEGTPVLFSWPSAGSLGGYLADRDATDQSRTALVNLIIQLAERPGASKKVAILAHSMGARLTLEALMQLKLMGRQNILDRLQVILAAPDVDVDLFREQIGVIGPMHEPITILASSDDGILRFSQRVSGGHSRLGLVDVYDPEVQKIAADAGVRIVDITDVPSDSTAHSRYVGLISSGATSYAENPLYSLRQAGAFVVEGIGSTLQSIGNVLVE
ncbi:protein of unknown function DUF900 hydrolase family protein [Ketogulonicigenium robustum]|uniref:Lipoprotein n=2 Tax=Ketogulonicigenium robustum TaxID=92947 RepID=A0A1W6NXH9_9RHOB|nr:protein of unknown function DUF900 hydrolase family protein [Ketogulonicigenium robustum]